MGTLDTVTVDRLHEASETLSAFGDAFNSVTMFDEEHEKTRVQIMLMVSFVNSAMADLALSLTEGKDLHDALRSTVRGDRKLDADAAMALQAAVENMKNPMKKN